MYVPKSHKSLSSKAAISFARKYGFATVISLVNTELEIVHIPIEVDEIEDKIFMTGHIARANKLALAIQQAHKVTVVFTEPHAYISSSWYDHINVPTWNYIAVHMKGAFRLIEGQELLTSLTQMVDRYEEGRPNRYRMTDMPKDMMEAHLNGLVGFEIEVDEIEANFKLSQNRNDKNYLAIIEQLKASPNLWDKEIARQMITLRPSIDA